MQRKSVILEFSICAALIFIVLTSGCAIGPTVRNYSGDKLQKSEVAVIKGWWLFALLGYEGLDIYALDGNYIGATKVEVLPGEHSLEIRKYGFSFVAPLGPAPELARVHYNFEAGHQYKMKYWFKKGIFVEGVRIIDVTTGAMILTQHFSTFSPYSSIDFKAGIQPLPENRGRWNSEEVDTIIDAIVTAAKNHGLKKKWDPTQGYTLYGKNFVLSLNAYFLCDENGIRHKSPSLLEAQSSSPFRHLSLRKLNIQKEKGTIWLGIHLTSWGPLMANSERLLVETLWLEVLNPLRSKFGHRMQEGEFIKIYKLKP